MLLLLLWLLLLMHDFSDATSTTASAATLIEPNRLIFGGTVMNSTVLITAMFTIGMDGSFVFGFVFATAHDQTPSTSSSDDCLV